LHRSFSFWFVSLSAIQKSQAKACGYKVKIRSEIKLRPQNLIMLN